MVDRIRCPEMIGDKAIAKVVSQRLPVTRSTNWGTREEGATAVYKVEEGDDELLIHARIGLNRSNHRYFMEIIVPDSFSDQMREAINLARNRVREE